MRNSFAHNKFQSTERIMKTPMLIFIEITLSQLININLSNSLNKVNIY